MISLGLLYGMETTRVPIFTLDTAKINWKFKTDRSNRRLKLYIKMNQAETEQWDTLKEAIKPPDIGDNEFARVLFFKGIQSFMEELTEKINNLSDDEKEQILSTSGLDVPPAVEESTDESETS